MSSIRSAVMSSTVSRISQFIRLAYVLVMLLLVVLMIGVASADRNNVTYHWTEMRALDSGSLSVNGQEAAEVGLPCRVDSLKQGDKIVLTCYENTILYDNLLFRVVGASLDIYIDDVLYLSTGQADTYPSFQRVPSPQVSMMDLPTADGVKEFRFVYTIGELVSSIDVYPFYVGDSAVLFLSLLRSSGVSFVAALGLFIAGLVLVLVSVISIRATSVAYAMAWMGLSCLAFGIWNLSANDLAVYFIPLKSLVYTVTYVSMLAVVPPLTVFYRLVMDRQESRALRLVSIVAAIIAICTVVLHLSGVLPFALSGLLIRLFIPTALVALGLVIVYNYLRLKAVLASRLLCPAALLAAFAVLDLVNIAIGGPFQNGLLLLGFMVFTAWMSVFGGRLVNQRFAAARQSERLAIEVEAMAGNLEKQRVLYQQLSESAEQVRMMRHDMRHQLSAIRSYIESGNNPGALAYIDELEDYTPTFAQLILTDNFSVNAVVSHYLLMAESNQIETDLSLVVPSDLGRISESDMSIVFGNLFENAIEASMYLPVGQRVIKLRSQVVSNNLTITVDNAFDGHYETHDGVFFSRKRQGRGIGLTSVQAIVDRYDGSMKIEITNGQFMVSLMVRM
ncbi:MAG: GHKL domain-containing protein [Coriobacteriia bacterium]|nr:GHKL domain-containing protein [Coriobacteriia bacterium]